MNGHRLLTVLGLVVMLVGSPGCHDCSYRACAPPYPHDSCDAYSVPGTLPPHPLTAESGWREPLPPSAVLSAPPPQFGPPAQAAPPVTQPPQVSIQPPASPDVRAYGPADNAWHPPANGGVRPPLPDTAPAQPPASARLYPPETPEPPPAANQQPRPGLARPDVTEEHPPTPSLPVGIPQFAVAQDDVTSGLKPSLDGLEWLRTNGYRTVLHLKPPAEPDSADRQVIEKYGLKYLSLDVSPETLSPALLEQFNRVVGDKASGKLFVYDRDGMLAGGLWYLHFRTVDHDNDEVARLRAARLGLQPEAAGSHRIMWLAIQKYLSEHTR